MALQEGACYAEVTPDALDQSKYVELVADPGAGAIASFVGVTRNSFQGKATERLEYEAYIPMAAKKLMVRLAGGDQPEMSLGVDSAHPSLLCHHLWASIRGRHPILSGIHLTCASTVKRPKVASPARLQPPAGGVPAGLQQVAGPAHGCGAPHGHSTGG